MEPHSKSKKRKPEDNGGLPSFSGGSPPSTLTKDDVLRMIEPLSRDQLAEIVASAALHPGPVLSSVRSLCGRDLSQRKLFVRGLGWETTHETLKSVFSAYGELDEAVVISDKATSKSKGYGFVTFRHLDGAILALKDPSKKIDGRIAVTQLASSGGSGSASGPNKDFAQKNSADVAPRKIFVGNVPSDMSSDRLLSEFSTFGEIQEGPVGIDKQTGKFKGFALFVYKTPQGAQAALANPNKLLDGHWLVCKPGGEGKKGKTGTGNNMAEPGPGGPMQGSEIGNNALSFPAQYAGTGTGTVLPSYNGTGTGVLSYPAGFNLPNNSMNNPNPNPNPNPNNNNGVGSYGPGSQYPGLAGLNFGNLGNSNPGLFRMNQATGFADPGQYPNQTQPGFSQPGLGQAGMGQVGLGQPVIGQQGLSQPGLGQLALGQMGQMGMGQTGQMGQAGLGQGGRMAGGPGFYPNNMQPPYY